jgi:outer membrane protein
MIRPCVCSVLLVCGVAAPVVTHAQTSNQPPPQTLTLEQAIQYATDHYPTVRAALEQVNVSAAGVDVAHAAYRPRLEALWQSNRATANNVFGQILPQGVIPALTGPVLSAASSESVWGSTTGALFSWEPLDFGLRQAEVTTAQAALTLARAGETLTRLDVQSAVAAGFLGVLAAQRAVTAVQTDLDRRNVLLRSVQTLVTNQLRPGADQSRAEAER